MADETEKEVEDLIRYDILAQEALRGVVRKVIQEVSRTGLPGEHHFYVTFDTQFSGVRMSDRMRKKYPEEMTIVIQHQFWDLESTEHNFSIGLSFDSVPESLLIPYAAVTGFFDPAVQFGLQFEAKEETEEEDDTVAELGHEKVSALPAPAEENDEAPADEPAAEDASADVVSLDAFRKK